MSNPARKARKRKERAIVAKAKVETLRKAALKDRKLALEDHLKTIEAHTIVNGKKRPIINDPAKQAARDAIAARNVADKLKANLELLEILEQEYEAEQAARGEMNAKLESEGYKSMREKMDALHQKALKMSEKPDLHKTLEAVAHKGNEAHAMGCGVAYRAPEAVEPYKDEVIEEAQELLQDMFSGNTRPTPVLKPKGIQMTEQDQKGNEAHAAGCGVAYRAPVQEHEGLVSGPVLSTPEEAEAFWTEEKLKEAKPVPMPTPQTT